jgi:autotransporter-associated beta strand protein
MFFDNSTGGQAQFITNAGGVTDFSGTLGPNGDGKVTAGSIAGAGNYYLGSSQLTVGGNNLSTTVSGVISDCGASGEDCNGNPSGGSLVKVGTGTLILTGANTYTGGTTINGGTLQLGNGGAGGSIVGNVLDNGIFAINRSDTYTFSGVISGTGAFQQNGAGNTILTATSTYSGATTVNAGRLSVNGSIVSSSGLTVNSGATVGGTGTLPSTTIS